MSNFIEEFKKGQADKNKGLYMGVGLHEVSKAINGVQKAMMYGILLVPQSWKK